MILKKSGCEKMTLSNQEKEEKMVWELSDKETRMYAELTTYKDVIYKYVENKPLSLNIMMPTKQVFSKIPVVIFVHGGGWTVGDPSAVMSSTRAHTTPEILNSGYAVISIRYSLLDGNIVFPQNIEDVKDSVRWVRKNAEKYNFDCENIGVFGGSAGAHLSLMVAYTDDESFLSDNDLSSYSSAVNYVIDINGPVEMSGLCKTTLDQICDVKELFGHKFDINNMSDEQKDLIVKCSPISYITSEPVPPTLIFHGTEDSVVLKEQSDILHKALRNSGNISKYIVIQDAEHGLFPISETDLKLVTDETVKFIKMHTK